MGAAAVDHVASARVAQPLAGWREQAACRDIPDLMSLPGADAEQAALAVCWHYCPVRDDCRASVMSLPQGLDPGGVCGALTEAQRRSRRRSAQHLAKNNTREEVNA